jgi:hypothetical protein
LGGLLVGVGFIGHRTSTDLRSSEVLHEAGRPERRMQLDVKRIVTVLSDGCLMDGENIRQAKPPECVVPLDDLPQHQGEGPQLRSIQVEQR